VRAPRSRRIAAEIMSIEPVDVLTGIAIGMGATLIMDAWNLFLKRMFSIQSLNLCWLGRWIGHMPRGTFTHANIAAAERKPFECALGWLAHYATGVTLALAFVALASGWRVRPTLLPALFFGIITVVFPFFVLQPSLGLGVASSRAPNPTQARLKSLMTHSVFGLGLFLSGLAMRYLVR